MNKIYTIIILAFISFNANAQKSDSTHTHYRIIRGGFVEHSTELKSRRNIKNGDAEIKNGRNIVATGNYKDNVRVGRWNFFNEKDSIEQIYNYDSKKLEFHSPNKKLSFIIDSAKIGDRVVYPAKIGGTNYGLIYLLKKFTAPQQVIDRKGVYNIYFIFNINTEGKLSKYEIKLVNEGFETIIQIPLKNLKPDDLDFTAAKLNGKNISSQLIYEDKFNVN